MSVARLGAWLAAALAGCDSSEVVGEVVRVEHGFDPDALVIADVDGDRAADTVAVSGALRTVGIAWGGGPQQVWSLEATAAGVAVGDFDGDGRGDVAMALPGEDAVAVLMGRAGRAFVGRRIAVGGGPRAVLAVRLGADKADALVVANMVDGTVSVIDRMIAGLPIVVGPGPRGLAAGDIDGDGDMDVAVALADADRVQLLRGTGDGLVLGDAYAVGAAPQAVVVAELDEAPGLDVATMDVLDATISVLHGDGHGGLRGPDKLATPPRPVALTTVQRTQARSNLVVLSRETATVTEIDVTTGERRRGPSRDSGALADGGLGKLTVGGAGRVAGLTKATGLQFEPAWTGPWVHAVRPLDIDGDGVDELVAAVDDAGRLVWWRDEEVAGEVDPGLGGVFWALLAGDVTGDGRRDLIGRTGVAVAVMVGEADGTFTPGAALRFERVDDVGIGDVNGDGLAELLVVRDGPPRVLAAYTVDVRGTLAVVEESTLEELGTELRFVDAGGGPAVDLLWTTGDGFVVVEDAGHGATRILEGRRPSAQYALADMDADGTIDAVGCGEQLKLYQNVLGPAFSTTLYGGAADCDSLELRDLDGDGLLDILLVQWDFMADRMIVAPFINMGGRSFQRVVGDVLPIREFHAYAELDGDGQVDAVGLEDGHIVMLRGGVDDHALEEISEVPFGGGVGGDVLVDVDRDGATDVLVVGDQVMLARGDGRGGFGPMQVQALQDILSAVRVDLDGDGIDEVVGLQETRLLPALVRIGVGTDGRLVGEPLGQLAPRGGPLQVGDVDGDRLLDVLLIGGGLSYWVLYRGLGDGTLAAPRIGSFPPPMASVAPLAVLDTDGDGRGEIIGKPQFEDALWRARWTGDGFSEAEPWLSFVWPMQFAVGDVDGDLVPDVALTSAGALVVISGRGASEGPRRQVLDGIGEVAIGDVDGDGTRELVALGGYGGPGEHTRLYVGRRVGEGWAFTDRDVPIRGFVGKLEVRGIDGAPAIVVHDEHRVTIVRWP